MGRRERKRGGTRSTIIDAAERLFAERDYAEVTVDEIAEAADVAKGTIYNHFPSKEDVAAALADAVFRRGLPAVDEMLAAGTTPVGVLEVLFAAGADWATQNPKLAHATSGHVLRQSFVYPDRGQDVEGFGSLVTLMHKLVETGQAVGELRNDIAAGELAQMLALLHAQTIWTGTRLGADGLRERMRGCLRVCLEGMAFHP